MKHDNCNNFRNLRVLHACKDTASHERSSQTVGSRAARCTGAPPTKPPGHLRGSLFTLYVRWKQNLETAEAGCRRSLLSVRGLLYAVRISGLPVASLFLIRCVSVLEPRRCKLGTCAFHGTRAYADAAVVRQQGRFEKCSALLVLCVSRRLMYTVVQSK